MPAPYRALIVLAVVVGTVGLVCGRPRVDETGFPASAEHQRRMAEIDARIQAHRARRDALEAETERLAAENRRLEEQIRALEAEERELERVREWYAERNAPEPEPSDPDVIPRLVLDVATALHVPEDALRAAFEAARETSAGNIARLKAAGAGGFRGLVAVLRGRGDMEDIDVLFAASWEPSMAGEEGALIDAAELDCDPALLALGHCDTPRTRSYLVGRLRGAAEADVLLMCAQSLGRLREPRALHDLARAVRTTRPGSSFLAPMARQAAVAALGDIGGDEARALLVDYLREEDSDLLAEAAHALRKVSPETARREAEALLAGPRAAGLSEREIQSLRECAAR